MKDQRLNRQIELQVSGLHVREAEGEQKSRTVEGYAMLFGVRSVNLTPWSSEREVYEVMEPGCITQDLLSRSDVVLTAFHNNQLILGRWRQGKGTLALEIDQRGLKTLIEVDGGVNTQNASLLWEAGADILVAGSAVFQAPDPIATIDQLKL